MPSFGSCPWFVSIGDINKDRVPDMVITHSERSELTVLIGNGSAHFTEVTANNGVRVMLGDGSGQFVAAPGSPFLTGKGTWHLAVSDVNGDGKPDVVTSNLESNNLSVLLGR